MKYLFPPVLILVIMFGGEQQKSKSEAVTTASMTFLRNKFKNDLILLSVWLIYFGMNNILQMAKDKTECISALQTALTLKKAGKQCQNFIS